jgi:hypothetical protein
MSSQNQNNNLNILCFTLFHPLIFVPILESISLIFSISYITTGLYYLQHQIDLPDTCQILPIPQLLVALGSINLANG